MHLIKIFISTVKFFTLLLQELPPVISPACLMPKGDKIDIEALWRSIPKYASLSESDKTWWRSYLFTLEATWKYPEGISACTPTLLCVL